MHNAIYCSPIGKLLLVCNEQALIEISFTITHYQKELDDHYFILVKTKIWLDDYFNGLQPPLEQIPIELKGTTFQKSVWEILQMIPYGKTISYNDIAIKIAKKRNIEKMSAQAVGQAVGHNPLPILIPCHRVVGSNQSLTGYSGGMEKKIYLLKLEQIELDLKKEKIIL